MSKSETPALWDLSVLYNDLNDPQFERDLADVKVRAKTFFETHRGKLKTSLGQAILDYATIDELIAKLAVYLMLRQSTDVANAEIKAKSAMLDRELSGLQGEFLTFFELEIAALEDSVLQALYEKDEVVKKHKPWLEHIRIYKPHFLSEEVEGALTKRGPFGPASWSEFFDEVESDLRFEYAGEKKNLTEMLHILTESKDAAERASVLKLVNEGLGGYFAKYSAQSLWVTVGEKAVEDRERGFAHPMDARNKSNRVPDGVVEALHKAANEVAAPLAERYYRLKARLMNVPTLNWSDRNAPMPFADTTTAPFSEAVRIVTDAYQSFSPTLAGIVTQFFKDRWVDAPATKTKRGGAFNCSIVLPGKKPASFTFLNYIGSNRDVMTLAHELGHGVHGMLAGEAQGVLMSNAPIAYCETASVFGEMVTFKFLSERMKAQGETKPLLAMLMGKIDDSMNTVVRQIQFSNFERRLHGMNASYSAWEEPKKRSPEELDRLWLDTLEEFYGKEGKVFTYENASHLWAYVSHFHRPFYVYGYAFGELLTQSLFAQRERLGSRFEPLYLELLKSGGTKNALELMKPFDLDPTKPEYWTAGLEAGMGAWISEAEALAKEIGHA